MLGPSAGSLENLGPISREALIKRPLIVSGCIGDVRIHSPHIHTHRSSGSSNGFWLVG